MKKYTNNFNKKIPVSVDSYVSVDGEVIRAILVNWSNVDEYHVLTPKEVLQFLNGVGLSEFDSELLPGEVLIPTPICTDEHTVCVHLKSNEDGSNYCERSNEHSLQINTQGQPMRGHDCIGYVKYHKPPAPVTEVDPHGKDPHDGGAKLDAGKPRMGLVLGGFAKALIEVGKVGTYGAEKYSDNGWLEVPDGIERYTDAGLRHLLYNLSGEANDPDTELSHLAHEAWNALAVLELSLRKK
jgi:hypothetical protein